MLRKAQEMLILVDTKGPRGEYIEYQPQLHGNAATREIKYTTFKSHNNEVRNKVHVLVEKDSNGNYIKYDSQIHGEQETKLITKRAFDSQNNKQKNKVTVLKGERNRDGGFILYDPKIHDNEETELITRTRYRNATEIAVLAKRYNEDGTYIIYNPDDHGPQKSMTKMIKYSDYLAHNRDARKYHKESQNITARKQSQKASAKNESQRALAKAGSQKASTKKRSQKALASSIASGNDVNYIDKPVTEKKKTADVNFLRLVENFVLDLNYFESSEEHCIWYAAILLNFYMHNSSTINSVGYGKMRSIDAEKPLLYYRSQTGTSHNKTLDEINKSFTKISSYKSWLDYNQPFLQLLLADERLTYFTNVFERMDTNGYLDANKRIEADDFALRIYGQSGIKHNNLQCYVNRLTELKENNGSGSILKSMEQYTNNSATNMHPINDYELVGNIDSCFSNFSELKEHTVDYALDVQSSIHLQRQKFAKRFAKASYQGFEQLKVTHDTDTTNLFIEFYPQWQHKVKESENYKYGVTNAIISFFVGLLNHHAELAGINVNVNWRQSFGFYRASVSHMGSMRMRLSLGLEPKLYNEIINNALTDLDQILVEFNLIDPNNSLVKPAFELSGKHTIKDQAKNLFLEAMESKMQCCTAAYAAHNFLNEYHDDDNNYLPSAFMRYVNDCILNPGNQKKLKPCKVDAHESKDDEHNDGLTNLLLNTILFTVDHVDRLKNLFTEDAKIIFPHTLLHTLEKLYNACEKGILLIDAQDKLRASHFYAKATLIIEKLLEYLISLETLMQLKHSSLNHDYDPVAILAAAELESVVDNLKINSDDASVFFTDNGQQANIASITALRKHFKLANDIEARVYMSDKSYFEVKQFLDKASYFKTTSIAKADIIYLDISEVDTFQWDVDTCAKAVIIDITNMPNLHNNRTLQWIVPELIANGIMVHLTSSYIKHEECGLDKFQAGKIITINPEGESLTDSVIEKLKAISDVAMHPITAGFLLMAKQIYNETITVDEDVAADETVTVDEAVAVESKRKSSTTYSYRFFDEKPKPVASNDSKMAANETSAKRRGSN